VVGAVVGVVVEVEVGAEVGDVVGAEVGDGVEVGVVVEVGDGVEVGVVVVVTLINKTPRQVMARGFLTNCLHVVKDVN